jgi:hypothetical protein
MGGHWISRGNGGCHLGVTLEFPVYYVSELGLLAHNVGDCGTPRYNGPKPRYRDPGTHNPRSLEGNRQKTPLPDDAEQVYRNAVPGDPQNPRAWYGKNANGDYCQFSDSNDGTAHYSGTVRPEIVPRYARDRPAGN